MDAEFASPKAEVEHIHIHNPLNAMSPPTHVTYYMTKPLPAIIRKSVWGGKKSMPDNRKSTGLGRLSKANTIIANAAEVAQLYRNASTSQWIPKRQRNATRQRNHALHILVTNTDDAPPMPSTFPSFSDPKSLVDLDQSSRSPRSDCTDNNGDDLVRRPSKI